jgi:hypothetical protein
VVCAVEHQGTHALRADVDGQQMVLGHGAGLSRRGGGIMPPVAT